MPALCPAIRAAALVAFTLLLTAPGIAAAEVTSLPDGRKLVIVQPESTPARGVILLIPGGNTTLVLRPDGETRSSNFVIRTRGILLKAGFTIAYMDDPGDLREPMARLRSIGKPVVLLSTSRGTILAAENAARLGSVAPDLLILTSPTTAGTGTQAELTHIPIPSLGNVNLRSLKMPTLVTTNDADTCRASPPEGAAGLVRRIGSNATLMTFSSNALLSDVCDALSPHGYYGIENDVLAKIIAWIAASTKPSN
jgi:hypothetical protein